MSNLKILHVVAVVSPTGAYGGPLRVAINQATELQQRGHEVLLVAGYAGLGPIPSHVDGVPARLFRVHQAIPGAGFSGLVAPRLVRFLLREAARYDLAHVHVGRDLISQSALWALRRSATRFVSQTHGMVGLDGRLRAVVADRLFVRRQLGDSRALLALTAREHRELSSMLPEGNLIRVLNGVPLPAEREPAPADVSGLEVLYCARLHPRKRPQTFVAAAAEVSPLHPDARFAIAGPDEGSLPAVLGQIKALGIGHALSYEGPIPYDEVLKRVSRAGIYVLPSVDEPFPMSLLEAMSLGVPSICTDSCGIADILSEGKGAIVTDGTVQQISAAIDYLLSNDHQRSLQGARGRKLIADRFGIEKVVDHLELIYTKSVS